MQAGFVLVSNLTCSEKLTLAGAIKIPLSILNSTVISSWELSLLSLEKSEWLDIPSLISIFTIIVGLTRRYKRNAVYHNLQQGRKKKPNSCRSRIKISTVQRTGKSTFSPRSLRLFTIFDSSRTLVRPAENESPPRRDTLSQNHRPDPV